MSLRGPAGARSPVPMRRSCASVPGAFRRLPAPLAYAGHAFCLCPVYCAARAVLNSTQVEMLFRLCAPQVHSSPCPSRSKGKEVLPKRCLAGAPAGASLRTARHGWSQPAPSSCLLGGAKTTKPPPWLQVLSSPLSQDALLHGPLRWVVPFSAELTLLPSPKNLCCSRA